MIRSARIKGGRGTRASTRRFARQSGLTDHQRARVAESISHITSIMSNLAQEFEAIEHSAKSATEGLEKFTYLMNSSPSSAVDIAVVESL